MKPVKRESRLPLHYVCCLVTIAVGVHSLMLAPASAQTRPPDIKAKERQDPASGDVVIINRKTRKSGVPSPYAPVKNAKAKEKPKTKPPVKTARPKPAIRRQRAVARAAPVLAPPPPLPVRNTRRRTSTARLQPFPSAELGRPEPQTRTVPRPRRAERSPSYRRPFTQRRYAPQRYSRHRPRRHCRRLARRCQAGFEGSCYMWQRRCT